MKIYKHFAVAFFAGILIMVLFVQPLFFLVNLGVPCHEELYIKHWLEVKERYASQVGKKIVFLSGSNTLFGIDAERMEQELNYPVLNGGSHAALDEYIFEWGKTILHPGDTVILPLEYGMYERKNYGYEYMKYICCYDADYFWGTPLSWKLNMVYRADLKSFVKLSIKSFLQPLVEDPTFAYNSKFLNANGDMTNNRKENRQANETLIAGIFPQVFMGGGLAQQKIEIISDFICWCRENQIEVYAAWPAYLHDDREFHDFDLETVQKIKEFYQSRNVEIVGEYQESLYPVEYFYDTSYHLTDEGKQIRTDYFIRKLNEMDVLQKTGIVFQIDPTS